MHLSLRFKRLTILMITLLHLISMLEKLSLKHLKYFCPAFKRIQIIGPFTKRRSDIKTGELTNWHKLLLKAPLNLCLQFLERSLQLCHLSGE